MMVGMRTNPACSWEMLLQLVPGETLPFYHLILQHSQLARRHMQPLHVCLSMKICNTIIVPLGTSSSQGYIISAVI